MANEELKSANEELQSNNEELQSTNEELDTSREELQSLNEEMMTVNAELTAKTEMLTKANDDLKNYLNRSDIAIIFLDEDLNIRDIDIGRPLVEITSRLAYESVAADAREVLRTLTPREIEVQRKDASTSAESLAHLPDNLLELSRYQANQLSLIGAGLISLTLSKKW